MHSRKWTYMPSCGRLRAAGLLKGLPDLMLERGGGREEQGGQQAMLRLEACTLWARLTLRLGDPRRR